MPVWSIKNRARKVRDKDFEECDLIEIEGSVFSEWLDKLRDNEAVAVDLKPGVVGTIVSPQKYLMNYHFKSNPIGFFLRNLLGFYVNVFSLN